MKSEEKTYLKDGTLWDDDKSDEFATDLIARMSKAADEGKLVVGSQVMREKLQKERDSKKGQNFSVSVKHLPKELQKELANV